MARFKSEKDSFRTREAMRFLLNLLRNRDGSVGDRIEDCDVFATPARLLHDNELADWYEAEIPKTVRTAAETRRGPDFIDFDNRPREVLRCLWCDRTVRPMFVRFLEKLSKRPLGPSRGSFRRNFGEYCDTLRLSPLDRELLLIVYLLENDFLEWPDRGSARGVTGRVETLAMYADRSIGEVRAALSASAPLRRYGCLDGEFDLCRGIETSFEGVDKSKAESRFFQRDDEKPLPWEWFGGLAERHGAILRRMLAPGTGPANILFYGHPGSGKTSFVRALAAASGRECLFVRQFRGPRRLGAVRACDNVADPDRSLLVVDESDALLAGRFGRDPGNDGDDDSPADKGALNAILDELRTPAVWICNVSPHAMDDSNLRRFSYSVQFDAPTEEQRAVIWINRVREAGLADCIPEKKCRDFAARWQVSAGGIAGVLRGVARLRPEAGEAPFLVESLMKPHCKLLGIEPNRGGFLRPAGDYSLDGLSISSSVPLPRIVEAAREFRSRTDAGGGDDAPDSPRFNLLLSGPPGTGKTEFVKYLGSELGAKIAVKMGSDLLSMWVGGTEKNISEAFGSAAESGAILFLDEADGILRSRAGALRSWEVTQVNEILHQMENFRGMLVCATNFSDGLDPASVRRFTFKVAFDYLANDGKAVFFERMFRRTLSPADRAELDAIPDLAPGDFRTVRQSLGYLGGGADNAALLDALRDESDAKRGSAAGRARIGFQGNPAD